MRRNANEICSILLSAALCALSGSARAQQEFDQEKAAKAIADSETFKAARVNDFETQVHGVY
jgi:Na+-transporting NADH:ubiquinone oxidoreductase subunit NqrC